MLFTGTKFTNTKSYQDKGFEIYIISLGVACEPQQGSSCLHKTTMSILATGCQKNETGEESLMLLLDYLSTVVIHREANIASHHFIQQIMS